MTELTEIDAAHAAMDAAPDDDTARLQFFERLADSELFLMLEDEPAGDQINPVSFDVEGHAYVLVFDRIERLSDFAGDVVPYAGLSGRGLAAMLSGQGIGWAVNPEVAPSSTLLSAEAVTWLAQTLAVGPEQLESRLREVTAPIGVPEILLSALDRKFAAAGGLADLAYLVMAEHDSGVTGHMVVFVDAVEGAQAALASAVGEALTFSGIDAGQLDVMHIRATDALAARVARVGLRFDLPKPEPRELPGANPGMDPSRPPKLR